MPGRERGGKGGGGRLYLLDPVLLHMAFAGMQEAVCSHHAQPCGAP